MKLSGQILITGGAGYLAQAIVRRATLENWDCSFTVLSRDPTKHHKMQTEFHKCRYIIGDICDLNGLSKAFAGHDIVIHAAAQKHIPDGEMNVDETMRVNYLGSRNVARAAIEARVSQVVGISTDKACVDWFTPVELADGSTVRISQLVKEKKAVLVKSVSPTGLKFTNAPVVNWFKNERGNRSMIKVSYQGALKHRGQFTGPWVTEDHLILTTRGWKQAGELSENDFLVTSEPSANILQMEVIVGTLLGDASIGNNGGKTGASRHRLRMMQSVSDNEWLVTKVEALEGFGFPEIKKTETSSRVGAFWDFLRSEFYPSGKKIVPRSLVEAHFSNLMLATWFMDDGTTSFEKRHNARPQARLATHGFTKEDVFWLSELLNKKGCDCHAIEVRMGKTKYWELRFSVNGTATLFNSIAPYVVKCMRRKLPIHSKKFDPKLWSIGSAVPYIAKAITSKDSPPPARKVYCIDVQYTHSFSALGVVLHNCHPVNVYGASKFLMERLFQEYDKKGLTQYHLVRYGNVLSSTGSVLTVWKQMLARDGFVTATSAEMSRFFMTVDDAVDLILKSLLLPHGTIAIPHAKSLDMATFRHYTMPDATFRYSGLRPGEKLHEQLITPEEYWYCEADTKNNCIRLKPVTGKQSDKLLFTVSPVEGLTSNNCARLTQTELLEMLK